MRKIVWFRFNFVY